MVEEKGLKDLKKQIKASFDEIRSEKQSFDKERSHVKKMNIAKLTEKKMIQLDNQMKDFNF